MFFVTKRVLSVFITVNDSIPYKCTSFWTTWQYISIWKYVLLSKESEISICL